MAGRPLIGMSGRSQSTGRARVSQFRVASVSDSSVTSLPPRIAAKEWDKIRFAVSYCGGVRGPSAESCRLVEDALDLAAVNIELAGDGALTESRLMTRVDNLFQRWRGR